MADKKVVKKKASVAKKGETVSAEPMRALSPFEEMERTFEEMRRDLMSRNWMPRLGWDHPPWGEMFHHLGGSFPATDVIDRDNEVVIHAELPGLTREDIEVAVSEGAVTIKGETCKELSEEKGDYVRKEMRRGSFSRTVSLPGQVDPDSAKATFKDGVLELTLAKVERAKRRTIKVE